MKPAVQTLPSRGSSEQGAVLIHVAVCLLGLLAFTAFVVDYGVMWASRGQAQTSADAGALAGAQSLLLQQYGSQPAAEANEAVRIAATALAIKNWIFSEIFSEKVTAGNVAVTVPLACPAPFNTPSGCIKVDFSKPDVRTFFAHLVYIPTQGVRATATAMVGAGANAVRGIKPWIVADRWTDNSETGSDITGWDLEDVFDPDEDDYSPTGFSVEDDLGLQLPLKGDGGGWSGGWSLEIDLGGGNGANTYRTEIAESPPWVPTVGLYNPAYACNSRADTYPERGCLNVRQGVRQGPTMQGLRDLIELDPQSYWNTATNGVSGGCMVTGTCHNPTGLNISPRIVPIAIFDPYFQATEDCSGDTCVARVVNLLGFFVEGTCSDMYPDTTPTWCGDHPDQVVIGRLMKYPGHYSSQAGNPGNASFLETITLVR